MSDAGLVIRRYLAAARRQWWVIAQAAVVVGIIAAVITSRASDPPFRASATLLFAEDTTSANRPQKADLLLAKKLRELTEPQVMEAAAKNVPGETPESVRAAITATINTSAGTLVLTATTKEKARPEAIADAVTNAYLDDQREKNTFNARQSLTEAEARRTALEQTLKTLVTPTGPAASGATGANDAIVVQRETLLAQLTQTYQAIEQLKVQIDAGDPKVSVLFPATDAKPAPRPSPLTRGVEGAMAGVMIGIGLAALREALDTKLRDRDAVEDALPWHVLAELTVAEHKGDRVLVAHDDPKGAVAEAVRRMRTNLRFVGGDTPLHTMVITSPQPGDGKTFLTANLAISYAQLGMRTLIVSGDLRRPSLDSLFIAKEGPGLRHALTEPAQAAAEGLEVPNPFTNADLAAMIRYTGVPNLWIMPSGGSPGNASELLSSTRAEWVFEQLAALADVVIIDAPPLVVVDPLLIGAHADGLIVVASVGDTQAGSARHARELLESSGQRILGLVLNRVTARTSSYGYGYGTYAYYRDQTSDETGKRRFGKKKKAS